MNWTYLWSRVKAIPAGVWAALGVALALFGMYLRGRRLEGELAKARLRLEAANAAAVSARNESAAQVHLESANKHAERADALQDHALKLIEVDKQEQKRIAALPPEAITSEFLKLAERKKTEG